MKKFLTFMIVALSSIYAFAAGNGDFFADAQKRAKDENRNVFLIFSGVEWCGPCKMYDEKILKSRDFKSFAKKKLIVIDIDSKRDKTKVVSVDGKELKVVDSAALDKTIKELNKKYPHGGVPFSVLLDNEGNVLETILGYSGTKPKAFVRDLKSKLRK